MTQQTTPLRAISGFAIANTKYQIKKINEDLYMVKSQSSPREYFVSKFLGELVCQCPDHTYRYVKCKHIHAVEFYTEINNGLQVRKRNNRQFMENNQIE
jgi:hypothetical protein